MANFKVICLIQQPFYLFFLPSTVTSIQGILPKTILTVQTNVFMSKWTRSLLHTFIPKIFKQRNLYFGVFHLVACRYNFQERIREWPNASTLPHLWTFLQSHLYRFSSAMVTWYNINPHLLFSLIWLRDLPRQKWMPCVQNVKIGRVGGTNVSLLSKASLFTRLSPCFCCRCSFPHSLEFPRCSVMSFIIFVYRCALSGTSPRGGRWSPASTTATWLIWTSQSKALHFL